MELLLINHPLDCPVCDKGGECPLQNQAMSNGAGGSALHRAEADVPQADRDLLDVLLDRERCVLCQRCTRFSEQVAGDPFIDLLERGAQQQIGTSDDGAVPVLLLRQHRADLPGRRADRGVLPVPRRGRSTCVSTDSAVRALRVRLPDPRRLAPRQGHPPAGRRRPRGQRGVDSATRAAGRSATPQQRRPVDSRPWCVTRRRARRGAPGPRRSSARARRPARARDGRAWACCPAAGSPRRTPTPTPSSPGWRSAPTTSTSAPGRSPPRSSAFLAGHVAGVAARPRLLRPLETARAVLLRRLRARGGVADRLPAAAQGRPRTARRVVHVGGRGPRPPS